MVEIEELIGDIKGSRKKALRDDFIWKKLADMGYSWRDINRAFSLSGRRKQWDLRHRPKRGEDVFKVTRYVVLNKRVDDELKKKAAKDNMTVYNEMKKIIIEGLNITPLDRKEYLQLWIRKKLTREQKNAHNQSARNYSDKVLMEREQMAKERKKIERMKRREKRRERRRKIFRDWKEEVRRQKE
jgi:hypothetical protein